MLPRVLLPVVELTVGWLVGVLPAFLVAAGEGTLRGAGDARCEGVVMCAVPVFFDADEGCAGCPDAVTGVDIVFTALGETEE